MNEQYEQEIRAALAHYPPKDALEYHWSVEAVRALLAEIDRLRATHARLVDAARGIADKLDLLDLIERDPRYRSVWEWALIHGQPQYDGPTCVLELDALRDALKGEQA
jgi:hypothetical protein